MLQTARLTTDEMDSFWRCPQESRELLLQAHSRARGLFLRFTDPGTNNRERRQVLISLNRREGRDAKTFLFFFAYSG